MFLKWKPGNAAFASWDWLWKWTRVYVYQVGKTHVSEFILLLQGPANKLGSSLTDDRSKDKTEGQRGLRLEMGY